MILSAFDLTLYCDEHEGWATWATDACRYSETFTHPLNRAGAVRGARATGWRVNLAANRAVCPEHRRAEAKP